MLYVVVVDWLPVVEANVADTMSFLCRMEAELKGVGFSRFAVTTLFPVLTRTYGLLLIVSGMVVPEVEIDVVCEEGIMIGALVTSLPDAAEASVTAAFLLIMCGDTCIELLDEAPLVKRFITSYFVFDIVSLL